MSELPLVTVLIPARDEARDIEGCLAAIAAQDYPPERMEVVVVDGGSIDGTAGVAAAAMASAPFNAARVIANPEGTTPSNLNAGLASATGEIVCRVDARTRVEPHYVRTCAAVLTARPEVAVVGGAQMAMLRDTGPVAAGIARALNNRWTMGGSRYRRSDTSGPSDTVYLGAFRRSDLSGIGGWDTRLPTNQDFDLNRRMSALGVVWFAASLKSGYLPRRSLAELWQQYRRFGEWKVRYWRLRQTTPSARQCALLGGPPLTAVLVTVALRRRLRWAPIVVLAALSTLDHVGARSPAGARERLVAAGATATIALAWWSGVVRELFRG